MDIILVGILWLVAGFVNGLSGMGAALFAVPIMTLFLDIHYVVPIATFVGTLLPAMLAIKYKQEFQIKAILPCLFFAVPGAILGSYTLKYIPTLYIEIFMAIILLSYVTWSLVHKEKQHEERDSLQFKAIAGLTSGFFGATISFTGPPIAMYILFTGMPQQKALGILGSILVITTGISAFSHFLTGFYTKELWQFVLIASPMAILGMWLSFPILKYITQSLFKKILLVIIGFAGLTCAYHVFTKI